MSGYAALRNYWYNHPEKEGNGAKGMQRRNNVTQRSSDKCVRDMRKCYNNKHFWRYPRSEVGIGRWGVNGAVDLTQ